MKVPSLNPFFAPQIVCPNCSNLVDPEVVSTNNKKAADINYICVNEEKDCGWKLTLSKQHILGDMVVLKQDEVDKLRAQKKELQAFTGQKEASIRQLVALLPELKKLVVMMHEAQKDVEVVPPTPDNPAASEPAAAGEEQVPA